MYNIFLETAITKTDIMVIVFLGNSSNILIAYADDILVIGKSVTN